MFQYYSLYPHYTVRENLEFPLKCQASTPSAQEIGERVGRVAKTLRIDHLLERKTDRLSGGEMQRVSIGRAIVRQPRVFLMDEPLSNLDAKLREVLRAELKDLQMKLGGTFLYVTHDQVEAMTWATAWRCSITAASCRSARLTRSTIDRRIRLSPRSSAHQS